MESLEKRREKKRGVGVLLASGGLLLVLLVALGLKLVGLAHFSLGSWLFSLFLTLAVQTALWLIPHFGWDAHLRWDRHYMVLPMLGAAILYCRFIAGAPETRFLVLMLWFVSLLFMAGLAGFREVFLLSTAMTGGYLVAVWLSVVRGAKISLGFEAIHAAVFWIICVYAGVVFERLQRDRREMQALRRQLTELALTDPLTGLPNRRHFEERARAELARIRRHSGRCSFVMIDLDHFKNYNDLLGHPAGDALLRELAGVMRSHLRVGDLASRYGGEEFAVLLMNASKSEGIEVLERLRLAVEAHPFPGRERQRSGSVTISAGLAGCPQDGTDYEGLIAKADAALYGAKAGGRNQVYGRR